MKLYELAAELDALWKEIEDNDGVLTEEMEKRLDTLPMDFQAKGVNVGLWIKNIKSERESIKAELEKLKAKMQSAQALEDRARKYLFDCMMKGNIEQIKHPAFTASIQEGREKVGEEIDLALLPDKFKETTVTVTPRKKEILDHYKNTGEVAPGAKIVKGDPYLVIRS